jgi:hypothetical protein
VWNHKDHECIADIFTQEAFGNATTDSDSSKIPANPKALLKKITEFTDEIIPMEAVIFQGNRKYDPHSELFATDDGT